MANNSTSVLVTWMVWWIVFINGLSNTCIWAIDVVTLFLMLTSETMMVIEEDDEFSRTILSSSCSYDLLLFPFLQILKEIHSEKLSITLQPGENSESRGVKDGKHSLDWLAISTRWPLTREYCWLERELRVIALRFDCRLSWESMREQIRWLEGNLYAQSWERPPRFWRWRLMGIKPAKASIPYEVEVLKAPSIQIAALLCIFPKIFRWYAIGACL